MTNAIPIAMALALAAAVCNAAWNVLLKTSGDPLDVATRATSAAALVVTPVAAVAWLLTGRPGLPPEAWALVLLSGVAELAYFVFLSEAYRRGELSVVYPLARGTAPLLAVLVGITVLRERPNPPEMAGVLCLLLGIWLVRRPTPAGSATLPALITGVTIAIYSAIDRVGVRLGPVWLYASVLAVVTAALLLGLALARRSRRRPELPAGIGAWLRALTIGMLMSVAYLLVLLALNIAPLTLVAPLRESAIVLVTLWGIWKLREREGLWTRVMGAAAIVVGAILLAV